MSCPYEAALLARWNADAAHDIGHIRRVWKAAETIADVDGLALNPEVLRAAVVFHDLVNLPKDHPERALASRQSAEAASAILRDMGWDADLIARAAHAIAAHSYSAGIPPETLEARVLRDADRLDALGAVGVARMMMVAGALGRALCDPDDPLAQHRALDDGLWSIDHFETKLFRLSEGMLTATGRRLAEDRIEWMRSYRARLLSEM